MSPYLSPSIQDKGFPRMQGEFSWKVSMFPDYTAFPERNLKDLLAIRENEKNKYMRRRMWYEKRAGFVSYLVIY